MTKKEGGQATVEFALLLPVVFMLLALTTEVVGVMLDQSALTHAARQAARVAIVDPSSGTAVAAARSGSRLAPHRLDVQISRGSSTGLVTASLRYSSSVNLPFSRVTLLRPQLHANAAMWVEHN